MGTTGNMHKLKIVAGLIVFNSDFVLKEMLDSIYPFVDKIIISEGCVEYWKKRGYKTSVDSTNHILNNYNDPENKLTIIHGTYFEKTDQCEAWFKLVPEDTDYIFVFDSDEILKQQDYAKLIAFLDKERPARVGLQSNTFYGGFSHRLGGFEREHNFQRILKYEKGCAFVNHRPPHLSVEGRAVTGKELFDLTGVEMYHYSYVFPRQVKEKVAYYEGAVISAGNCIPNYFTEVWEAWVNGGEEERKAIEDKWQGVHEFIPAARGECRTEIFTGEHPEIIKKRFNL